MAIGATTKFANRYGVNLKFYPIVDGAASSTASATIDYANSVSLEITGDAVYATGGQGHKRMVGFNNPIEGSMTISTQMVTPQLVALLANGALDSTTTTFKSDANGTAKNYKVEGETLWKGDDGNTYSEKFTAHKVLVKPNYSAQYTGDGDPHSIDVNLELLEDETNGMITFTFADQPASSGT